MRASGGSVIVEHYFAIVNVLDRPIPHRILQRRSRMQFGMGWIETNRRGTIRVTGRHGTRLDGAKPICGVGLFNVEERLNARYRGKASLGLIANPEGGAPAIVFVTSYSEHAARALGEKPSITCSSCP